MVSTRSLPLLLVLACTPEPDDERRGKGGDASDCDTELVGWDTFARGYLSTWCTPCHSSELVGASRSGAPEGVDFETWAGAALWAERIGATSIDASMPPAGGPSEEDRERILEWVECGAPGEDPPPSACDVPQIHEGDVLVDATFDAQAFCDAANTIAGDLTLAANTLGPLETCLCEVQGDVSIEPGAVEVSLQELTRTGALDLTDSDAVRVSLPALTALDGSLTVTGNATLVELELPQLADLTGAVTVSGNATLELVALPELTSATSVTVTDNARLRAATVSRLESVEGDFLVADNPTLEDLMGTEVITTIGGHLTLRDNASLLSVDKFTRLVSVGGDLSILRNTSLSSIHGFYALETIEGPLSIEHNPSLAPVMGFALLEDAGGLSMVNNDAMDFIGVFMSLTTLRGDLTILNHELLDRIDSLPELQEVTGNVEISNNPFLASVTGLTQLHTVGGFVSFDSERLEYISGLGMLTDIGDTLSLEDTPLLVQMNGFHEVARTAGVRITRTGLPHLNDLANLTTVTGDLLVRHNPDLLTVQGLSALERVEGALRIRYNSALPQDDVDQLVETLGPKVLLGEINIEPNGK